MPRRYAPRNDGAIYMTKSYFHDIILFMKKTLCLLFLITTLSFAFAERPIVHDIQARATGGTKVRISWTLPQNPEPYISSLILYRTTEQVSSFRQLAGVSPLATLSPQTTEYTDILSDLKDYYYTVLSLTDTVYDVVLLSFNSTVTGVHLNAKKASTEVPVKPDYETVYPEGTLRKTPLPFIDMIEGMNSEPLVSNTTAQTAKNSLSRNYKKEVLTPYIFEEDLVSPDGGDDYLLFEILKASFVTKKYKEAIDKLNKLIGTNISDKTRNRAYFYLGESQYFNHDYEDAVRSFVKVEQNYPTLAKKWLEASLDRI